jgi:hypothetical protein
MRPIYKLLGIAVVAFVVGGGIGVSVQAARSPSAIVIARARLAEGLKVAQASQTNQGSKHACVDLNGGSFEWRWANAPFASSCDARPDAK